MSVSRHTPTGADGQDSPFRGLSGLSEWGRPPIGWVVTVRRLAP